MGWGALHNLLNRELPKRIFRDERLRPMSRLVYLGMRTVRKTHIAGYARALGMPDQTVRDAVKDLRAHGWVYGYRDSATGFEIIVPWMPRDIEAELARRIERLAQTMPNWGEGLMKMMLSLIVDDDDFVDNHRFDWASSGQGDGAFEFDRMYEEAKVGCEFQGPQHYQVVQFRNGPSDLVKQQARDRAKALACERHGITLVEIPDVELSYETLVAKLEGLLPLIQPLRDGPLFMAIQRMCDAQVNRARGRRAT